MRESFRLWIALALFLAMPADDAHGAHCPYGQIFRVHLKQCFPAGSPMVRAYAEAPRSIRARGHLLPLAGVDTLTAQDRALKPSTLPFPLPALDRIDWGGPPADNFTKAKLLLRGMMDGMVTN